MEVVECLSPDSPRFGEPVLFQVLTQSDPVYHRKRCLAVEWRQHAMPYAATIVYALSRGRHESQRPPGDTRLIGRDNDKERFGRHWQERLRAKWMTLNHLQIKRELTGFSVKHRNTGVSIFAEVKRGEVVVSRTEPFVDHSRRTGGFDDLAKGREQIRCKRLNDNLLRASTRVRHGCTLDAEPITRTRPAADGG